MKAFFAALALLILSANAFAQGEGYQYKCAADDSGVVMINPDMKELAISPTGKVEDAFPMQVEEWLSARCPNCFSVQFRANDDLPLFQAEFKGNLSGVTNMTLMMDGPTEDDPTDGWKTMVDKGECEPIE